MDRGKNQPKRGPKVKTLPLPGDFIALGPKAPKSSEGLELKLGAGSSLKQSHSLSAPGSSGERKRDAPSGSPVPLGTLTKKKKLSSSLTSGGRPVGDERRDRDINRGDLWDSNAIEVDPADLLSQVLEAEENGVDEQIERLLCGTVKQLRATRVKPDSSLYLSLMILAKIRPSIFCSDRVTIAFCSLLKRDVSLNFKTKGNVLVSVLSANLMMAAYQNDKNWPELFVKVYLDDALGERSWVDHEDCKGFVDNIQTAFMTKSPPKGFMIQPELTFKPDVSSSPPPPAVIDIDDDTLDSVQSYDGKEKMDIPSIPRYAAVQESVEHYVMDVIRDHVMRKQPMDNISRNMLKVLARTCGLSEVRLLVAQRLEMWLQNPKLMRPAQELLLSVCLNCNQHNQQDVEVISHLIKVRLKTKPLINHYLQCIRELLGQHSDNLSTVLKHTIYNELSNSRNPNNMALLNVIFQHSPEQAAKIMAEVFQDVLNNREDYLRAVRGLYREIVRFLRHDISFPVFCLGLMKERKESQFKDLDQSLKDRLLLSTTDLITLSIFLSITPAVKEAASAFARGDKKDVGVLRTFQQQIANIQRDAVWWLHTVVPKMFKPARSEFVHCLHKVLFMEQPEQYYNKDNWPMESDRLLMFRLASEAPLLEDTLMRVLVIGLSKEHPINPVDALELADQLVKRAAMLYTEDFHVIQAERVKLINAVFNLCVYHYPENITLPTTYQPPTLAIASLYWKAWTMLLIVTAHNPSTFGRIVWDSYPTLRGYMEMCITNHFAFPPPTMALGERADEIRAKELQMYQLEKQQILEFESYLASATNKVVITETNSHLLSTLTTMDPRGVFRRPPSHVLEQLKALNLSLKLGHLLCRSRNPDFLLDIIQRQGPSQSMPWLAELVESSEGAFHVLPVQCLCEFLLNETSLEELQFQHDMKKESKDETKAEKAEKARRKEKQRKQQQLLSHLQQLLHSNDSSQATFEVLDYFLRRLSSQQSTARIQAAKGLSLLLTPTTKPEEEEEDDMQDKELSGEHSWLLKYLPSLSHFGAVQAEASLLLRQACQIECNPFAISSYIQFLADYAPDDQLQDLADLALDMAELIVERTTIMNCILPMNSNDPADCVTLLALYIIFVKYLRRAREPSKEAYSWSESQDHIIVQWPTGEIATMHIRVVHAMVILLTCGPPADPSYFEELLEIWFASESEPPQAFLMDTSEEALLLPDWLKLRMIRSSVEPLVDAALRDLDPGQLVLFLQSFGIPVSSVSKLLQSLDIAVEYDCFAVEQAVVDKGYMAQLVEVQQLRGAIGGRRFAEFLAVKDSISSEDQDVEILLVQPVMPTPSHIKPLSPMSPSSISSKLRILFDLDGTGPCSKKDRMEIFRSLEKALTIENKSLGQSTPVLEAVITFLIDVLNSVEAMACIQGMHRLKSISCSLIRQLVTGQRHLLQHYGRINASINHVLECMINLSSKVHVQWTPLIELLKHSVEQTVKQKVHSSGSDQSTLGGEMVPWSHTTKEAKVSLLEMECTMEGMTQAIRSVAVSNPYRLEQAVQYVVKAATAKGQCNELIAAFTNLLVQESEKRICVVSGLSLLVDWLELLEPEVIGCATELQQLLVFHMTETGKARCPYFLSVLAHQSNWATLRRCIRLVLQPLSNGSVLPRSSNIRFDPSAVLDFLWACVNNPKIWRGRDKHIPKHLVDEDVLGLTTQQVIQVVNCILEEVACDISSDGIVDAQFITSLNSRLPLLLHCCHQREAVLFALMEHLEDIFHVDDVWSRAACHLMQLIYLKLPYVVRLISDSQKLFSNTESTRFVPSKVDPIAHNLVMTLSGTESGKDWKEKIDDIDLACRKMAAAHPILSLRQLPMLATTLRGRVQLEFSVFKSRNHLEFFRVVMGLLELLQPYIFRMEYDTAFQDICESYFLMIKTHGQQKKEIGPLTGRLLSLLSDFLVFDTQRALRYIQQHVEILSGLSTLYPDLPSLRSILSAVSLPCQTLSTDTEIQGSSEGTVGEAPPLLLSFTPQQQPPWTQAQLTPIFTKLSKEDSIDDILSGLHDLDSVSNRKVSIIEPFSDYLKRMLVHPNDSCRNLAHNLVIRYVTHKPSVSQSFLKAFLCCLESSRFEVVCTGLERLAEYVLLCQESASLILEKAFDADVNTHINAVPFISEAIMLLNMQSGT